jgi:hypothetical protein
MLLVLGRALIASIFLVMSVLHIMEPVEQAGQEDRPAIHLTASAYALNAFELGSGTAISTGVAISWVAPALTLFHRAAAQFQKLLCMLDPAMQNIVQQRHASRMLEMAR